MSSTPADGGKPKINWGKFEEKKGDYAAMVEQTLDDLQVYGKPGVVLEATVKGEPHGPGSTSKDQEMHLTVSTRKPKKGTKGSHFATTHINKEGKYSLTDDKLMARIQKGKAEAAAAAAAQKEKEEEERGQEPLKQSEW